MSAIRPPDTPGPKGITEDEIVEALEKNGGVVSLAAQALGIRRQSLSARVNASERLDAARSSGQDDVTDIARAIVVTQIVKKKDVKVAQWWLERRSGGEFANKHTGGDGEKLFDVDEFMKAMPDDQLHRLDAATPGSMGQAGPDEGPPGED